MVKLDKLKIFKYLSKEDIDYVSQYLKSVNFLPDDEVMHQGTGNENLYIVDSGQFRISVILPGDYSKEIFQLGAGDFFGETSMLSERNATASVTAITPSSCIVLTRDILTSMRFLKPELAIKIEKAISELANVRINQNIEKAYTLLGKLESRITKTTYASFQRSTTYALKKMNLDQLNPQQVQDIDLFKYLGNQKLKVILPVFEIISAPRGYQLHFDNEAYFGIVFQGAIQYLIKYSDTFQKNLEVVGPGYIFGQQTFFGDHSPHLEIHVREDAIILLLYKIKFDELKNIDEELYQQTLHYLCIKTVSMLYAIDREYARLESEYGDLLS